ncbi:MAG TPA: prenyltransferase/squalene oxidase repeat-containing protein [Anaerolineales bacterium]|nr:prenyltransferase/squalene oxidase repeat-containing protein [Anaerolineales bacterium]
MTPRRFLSLVSSVLVLSIFVVPASAASSENVASALAWLRATQLADGGFSSGFSDGSDIGATADAVVAIASAGGAPAQWRAADVSPIDFLEAHVAGITAPGLAAKVALALIAAGEDPAAFGEVDLTAVIAGGFDPAAGFYGGGPYDSALAILALSQATGEVRPEAVAGLLSARQPDGSYAFDGTMAPGSGDSNTTALAVQALLIAGSGEDVIPSLTYFRETQNVDGGWTYQKPSAYGEATDSNSTALVIQALLAAGQDLAQWGDPMAALVALQQPSGALAFNADTPGDNALSTLQAIPALAGVDLTDLSRLSASSAAPNPAATSVLVGAFLLLVLVLLLSAIVAKTERA